MEPKNRQSALDLVDVALTGLDIGLAGGAKRDDGAKRCGAGLLSNNGRSRSKRGLHHLGAGSHRAEGLPRDGLTSVHLNPSGSSITLIASQTLALAARSV